ncbi:MAG: hypothetical protein AAGJ32_07155 [Pseudomonadota bacterium]
MRPALKTLLATTALVSIAACETLPIGSDTAEAPTPAQAAAPASEALESAADTAQAATADAASTLTDKAEPIDASTARQTLAEVLASDIRTEDAPRDIHRRPLETLTFFGITPDMTVAEYAPGGGWYTRVLAPYMAGTGRYLAANHDIDAYLTGDDVDPERFASAKAFPETFPGRVNEWTGLDPALVTAFEIDEAPEAIAGTVDALLVFRSMHGLTRRGIEDDMAAHAFALLKPGGTLGLVQHRAKADAPDDYADGSNGYLRQADVIANFEAAGFTLIGTSEVNANAKDTADYEGGVWTLPPVLRGGEETRATYEPIGESDRMTLKFRKPV